MRRGCAGLSKSMLLLILLNLISGIMHILFEFHLLDYAGLYHKFILIENLLIGFIFIYFSWGLFFGEKAQRDTLVLFQLSWWIVFSLIDIACWGSETTLGMFKTWLPLSESLILLVSGVVGIILSILIIYETKYLARNKSPCSNINTPERDSAFSTQFQKNDPSRAA